jgi:hypothetical protein
MVPDHSVAASAAGPQRFSTLVLQHLAIRIARMTDGAYSPPSIEMIV